MSTLPCFACGKVLEPAFRAVESDPDWLKANQPYAGTMFISHGNYGSTVYDPSPGMSSREYLEINICDECLLGRLERVLMVTKHPAPHPDEAPWDADGLLWCETCGRAVLPEDHEHQS